MDDVSKNSQVSAFIRALIPSLTDILFSAVFIVALASGSQMLSIDSDLGRHLTIGNYILEDRAIPTRDLFSHTLSNQPRPPYEWLSQVLFALADRLLGLDGVILWTAVILALTFALVFKSASRRSQSVLIAFFLTILGIAASSIHWLPRPHIITFLLLAIWIENLEQVRKGQPLNLVLFPLIMLFWANLHGGFVFGVLAWCAYFAGWFWDKWQKHADEQTGRKLLMAGSTSLVASVMTPDFWHNWEAVLNNRSTFILSRTGETMPPNLADPSFFPFTILLALTFILVLINYKTLPASHFFLLAGLGFASLWMARNIPLFVIACTPIASELAKRALTRLKTWAHIEKRFSGFGREPRWHLLPLGIAFLTVALIANHHLPDKQTIFQFNAQVFPVQAINWLEQHPQDGRMFNEFNWGGYILYRMWPGQRVFLDSQSDFYGEILMRDYEQVVSMRGDWENVLKQYQVGWMIIPSTWPLADEMKTQGWSIVYQDETAIILALE